MSYNPSNHIPLSKAMGPAGFPLDGKFMYFTNGANGVFKYRPFQSVQEALDYFPLGSIFRGDSNGQPWAFEILINTGGTLSPDGGSITGGSNNAWWWKDGVLDADLIQKITADTVVTASNGLNAVGNDIRAGGDYTSNITIGDLTTKATLVLWSTVAALIYKSGTIQITDGAIDIFVGPANNQQVLHVGGVENEIYFLDSKNRKGAGDQDDYSLNKTAYSYLTVDMFYRHEIIPFTDADGSEINIDLTINNRQKYFPNPYICAYNTIPVNPTTNKKKLIAGITPEITEVSGLNTNIAIGGIIGDGYFLLTNN